MALKISLKAGEKFAVNGAVLVNGDRRAEFLVENKAAILREGDIMQADDATTPASLIYLPVMMMALDPSCRAEAMPEFARRLTEFAGAVDDVDALQLCLKTAARVANGDYYKALTFIRSLMSFEATRLENAV